MYTPVTIWNDKHADGPVSIWLHVNKRCNRRERTYTFNVIASQFADWAASPIHKRHITQGIYHKVQLTVGISHKERPGSVDGIAGRSGDRIPVGRDFPHLSRPALRPTQHPVQWVPGLSRGKVLPGLDADPSPPSSAEV